MTADVNADLAREAMLKRIRQQPDPSPETAAELAALLAGVKLRQAREAAEPETEPAP